MINPGGPQQENGLMKLLRNPQFVNGIQQFITGMTEHPDPGFHSRMALAQSDQATDLREIQKEQQERQAAQQQQARTQAFLQRMVQSPKGIPGSAVDPSYRPPGMPDSSPLAGMDPAQQTYLQGLMKVDPGAAMKAITEHRFQGGGERRIVKGADGKQYYTDTREPVLPGVTPAPKAPDQRTKKIQELVGRGVPYNQAADLVDGRVKAIADPVTGKVGYHNLATGTATGPTQAGDISKKRRASLMDESSEAASAMQQLDRLEQSIDKGVGLVSAGKDVLTGIVGQIPEEYRNIPGVGPVGTFPDVSAARTDMKLASEALIVALSKNPKVPVYEQQRLAKLLDLESLMTSPEQAKANISAVRQYLEEVEGINRDTLGGVPSVAGKPDYSKMSLQELNALLPSEMTEEELKAAADAYDRLSQ